MTDPLDILRAPAPRAHLEGRANGPAELRSQSARAREGSAGDIALAIAAFNAEHPVHELLASAGVELHEQGREWHTINGCPLPGCSSTHDAFRVHIDRNAGDTRGPQWACRKCQRGGDALRLAMLLAGADPNERGATARFLRQRGHLADTCGPSFPDSRAGTGIAVSSHGTATKHPARTRDFAQERSRHVKTTEHTFERKQTPACATNLRTTQQGQVPCPSCPVQSDGNPVPATGEGVDSAPVGGRGELYPGPVGGLGGRVPADPLRWSRPDVLAAFGRHPTPDQIEALDERAGIIEFDAGLTRQQAEAAALHRYIKGDNL